MYRFGDAPRSRAALFIVSEQAGFELRRRQRPGEQVTLHFLAAYIAQKGQLLPGFEPSATMSIRFMTVEGGVTAKVFREFLKRLIAGMDRKIILIVDGHPTHRARLVKRFVADNAERLELVFLPPYSPELNPDELVWAHVKKRIAKAASNTKDALKRTIDRAMRSLQKMPDVVSGFFHAPTCSYANL